MAVIASTQVAAQAPAPSPVALESAAPSTYSVPLVAPLLLGLFAFLFR
ncbi:hypothetical protein KP509_09G012700 [Ceratopteris richardii]|nr:hypothetical protein KP509_09G012700 [Ceratopteris richardii]